MPSAYHICSPLTEYFISVSLLRTLNGVVPLRYSRKESLLTEICTVHFLILKEERTYDEIFPSFQRFGSRRCASTILRQIVQRTSFGRNKGTSKAGSQIYKKWRHSTRISAWAWLSFNRTI